MTFGRSVGFAKKGKLGNFTKCLKNKNEGDERRGEVGKITPKKEMDNPSFI